MKVLSVLTSASSGVYIWSDPIDTTRHADNWEFNLEWSIVTSATTVSFVWSGSSIFEGTYTRESADIVSGATSGFGTGSDGRGFTAFTPDIFPFIKIGAKATGTTSVLSGTLIMR